MLFSFSIEELLDLEVTSASKKPQRLSQTTAATFVITQEDIRRSGAQNIPEALRMAPGVQVAQIDANKWAITVRGFNGRFANKLLVMIDGRTVYTPTFSGVYWDTQDTFMGDVERIEVIRGPGGTMWGANAVNGVINVITKSSKDSETAYTEATAGNQQVSLASRFTAALSDTASYKVFASYKDIQGNRDIDGVDTNDDWSVGRVGGRFDWTVSDIDEVMVVSEAYSGESGETVQLPTPTPPFVERRDNYVDVQGAFVLGRWDRAHPNGSHSMTQAYVDYSNRDGVLFSEKRTTVDLELRHRLLAFGNNDIVLGLEFRSNRIDVVGSPYFAMSNDRISSDLFNFFFEDEIIIAPDKFSLILGTKLEHNDLSPDEIDWMPSIRGLWQVNPTNTLWAGVTRAVRTPSMFEQQGSLNTAMTSTVESAGLPPLPYPVVTQIDGNLDQQSEKLISYELGYRLQPTARFSADIALFYNDYDDLRNVAPGIPTCEPSGAPLPACLFDPGLTPPTQSVFVPSQFANDETGDALGAEIAFDWAVLDNWRIKGAYTYLDLMLKPPGEDEERSGEDPQHQLSVQSLLSLGQSTDFDVWVRYVDDLSAFAIDSYWTLDTRIAWRVLDNLELSLVGKNLIDSGHVEFASETEDIPLIEIQRSYLAELRWAFE
ncbi:MAG: TonB-dependent receptor plug domain-containing protein [Gammaproteobacteria bacterium]